MPAHMSACISRICYKAVVTGKLYHKRNPNTHKQTRSERNMVFPSLNCPEIIAHRGASYDAPENTIAAFNLAWEQKADGIEGDFRLTGDGRIVCIHDATTGRTAGTDLPVSGSAFKELRTLDTGSWKGNEWAGERIPSVEEVFSIVPADKKIFVEIKSGTEIIGPLRHAIFRSRLKPEQVVVISFDRDIISRTKKQIPHLKTLWLSDIRKDKRQVSGHLQ